MSVLRKIKDTPGDLVVCVVGLGYVGLPLAVAFSEHYRVIGLDTDPGKIQALIKGEDPLGLYTPEQLKKISFISGGSETLKPDVFVIAVPTDIDEDKHPNLRPLKRAIMIAAELVVPGGIIIVESTVYPGATRELVVPMADRVGAHDIFFGFSPERIVPGKPSVTPGDLNGSERTLANTVKIVSGSTPAVTEAIRVLYARIIPAGLHVAPSIEVAEAAKILENTQRDVNIALMNEFSMICDRLKIDTQAVIDAAATKWNFHPYRPGLVGGHCIGVDPYYLAYQAKRHGYHPHMVLAGRQINDRMGIYVARQAVKMALKRNGRFVSAVILGATFKENCQDLRNSRVTEIIKELLDFGVAVSIHDPVAPLAPLSIYCGARVIPGVAVDSSVVLCPGAYEVIIAAVDHTIFKDSTHIAFIAQHLKDGGILVDVKGSYRNHEVLSLARPGAYWHL